MTQRKKMNVDKDSDLNSELKLNPNLKLNLKLNFDLTINEYFCLQPGSISKSKKNTRPKSKFIAAESFFKWSKRQCQLKNQSDEIYFQYHNLEFPENWSQLAVDITASKYFKKTKNEKSLKQLVSRVSGELRKQAVKQKYLSQAQALIYENELKYILYSQRAAFNSPVWFNVGVYKKPQSSACFIQSVEDSLSGIFDLLKNEAMIFKYGSGTGSNFSNLRSKYEALSGGGVSSGLMSFLDVFDRAAGAIKSGGTTRRAAKMVIVDIDHPEIEEFINLKKNEEKKASILLSGGYSGSLEGEITDSLKGQNANNSVRVTNEFMKSVLDKKTWNLKSRTQNKTIKKIDAYNLWQQIGVSAYASADPGIQFHDTINQWNPCQISDDIKGSNPCSEFMFLDNTSCNLASLNLIKFLDDENQFLIDDFLHTIKIIFFSQELLIDFSSYPTDAIEKNSKIFRPLGIGFANLGGFLLKQGIPYDSELAREWASFLSATLTGYSYYLSTEFAKINGSFLEFKKNKKSFISVLKKHQKHLKILKNSQFQKNNQVAQKNLELLNKIWKLVLIRAERFGVRNAQASVMAPTGTIGFFMDCDTTGIEPEFSMVKYKKMVSDQTNKNKSKEVQIKIINNTISDALKNLGYTLQEIIEIKNYILSKNTTIGCGVIKNSEHHHVFQTAVGGNPIRPEAHILMMAAIQPFISGAISKTVNLPQSSSVADILEIYMSAWKLGLKSVAVYRDQSKFVQPLNSRVCPECGGLTEFLSGCYTCPECGTSLSC